MKPLIAIRSLLSALAIAGLLLAPIARPALAMDMSAPMTSEQTGMAMDAASMGEMPCCPDEGQKSNCAKDCPLMAICMATAFQNVSYSAVPVVFFTLARTIFPVSTPQLEGLTASPSPRPPNA